MDERNKHDGVLELTDEEFDEIEAMEETSDDTDEDRIPEYYFSNPDPYARVAPRPADAPKRDFRFDEDGNIVVKNPSAFWLPEVKIVEEAGGTEFTVTGSYEGTEPLHKKLIRIMEQQTAGDETGITEKSDET